jgi:hypothetical protein
MISAVTTETFQADDKVKCDPGTLRLRRLREGEAPVFTVLKMIEAGEEVWLVPLDPRLSFNGVPVAGATVLGSTGTGVAGLLTPQTGE